MPSLYELADDPTAYAGTGTPLLLSDGRILNWRLFPVGGRARIAADYFDANGVSTGQSFLTTHPGLEHRLIALNNGGVAIAYHDNDSGPPATLHEVYLTIYNSLGALVVEAVQVNVIDNNNQYFPDVAVLDSGRIVIAWMDDSGAAGDGDRGVIARIYNPDGTPAGGPFVVNTTLPGSQQYPTIAALPDGGFLIAWNSGRQLFDANGVKVGPERPGGFSDVHPLENGNIVGINGDFIAILDPTGATVLAYTTGPGGGVQFLGSFANGFVVRFGGVVAIFDNMGVQQGSVFASPMSLVAPGDGGGFDYYSSTEIGQVRLDDGMGVAVVTSAPGGLSETTPQNNLVASLATSGEALNTTYTLELVSDSLGGGFELIGNRLFLVDNSNLDFETASTVTVTIAATDLNGNQYVDSFTLNVIDETVEQRITASPALAPLGVYNALLAGDRFVSLTATLTGQIFDADLNLIKSFKVVENSMLGLASEVEILALPSGGFVVTWQASEGDGQGEGIVARIFDADGVPTTDVIVVNSPTFAVTRNPDIVLLGSGDFLIAWHDVGGDGGGANGFAIRAQRFTSAGVKVGAEFTVNTTVFEAQMDVSLHPLGSGGFLATWTDLSGQGGDSAPSAIKGQLFDSSAQRVGGEFLVNTITAGPQHSSNGITLASGQLLITWANSNPVDSLADGTIRGQLFDTAGARVGGEIVLQAFSGGQGKYQVEALPSGGFALAWTDRDSLPDDSGTAAWARLFNADGSPAGSRFLVNTNVVGNQSLVDLALLPGGELHIVWGSTAPSAPTQARIFDLTGTRTEWSVDDTLPGTPGADVLRGGPGNDTYIVNHPGNVVIENPGEGVDIIFSAVSYALNNSSEVEVLATIAFDATDPINLTGNGLANYMIGNDGANQLDGKAGADVMVGRAGNDTYTVDNGGDEVVENAGGGSDIVFTSVSYALNDTWEVEVLATRAFDGTDPINLIGNGLANYMIGNDGANTLDGKAGADVMVGRAGHDTYIVYDAGDEAVENAGGGVDILFTAVSYALNDFWEVEVLATIAFDGTAPIDLTGNGLDNYMIGNDGANTMDGKGGSDVLVGRAGEDRFAFTTALGAGNVDNIFDFVAADDTIALDDAVFAALAPGALADGAFRVGTAAQDLDDRIIYDQANGQLFYDSDGSGNGAAILFATLSGTPALTAGDFIVI